MARETAGHGKNTKEVAGVNVVKFTGSYTRVHDCPGQSLPEFAFAGRSNVGKSSLINALTGRKNIARVSATPGKTQTINYYYVDGQWYLVDLPGYGYARISKTQRKNWERLLRDYFAFRENLLCVFVLIDARIPPQQSDIEFINMLGELQAPFVIVFTKIDKVKNKLAGQIEAFRKALEPYWEYLPEIFTTSAVKKQGVDELLIYIKKLVKEHGSG